MIPKRDQNGEYEPGVLQCPECGMSYLEKEAPSDEGIKGKFSGSKPMIVSARSRKKKYNDKQGNEINDPDQISRQVR